MSCTDGFLIDKLSPHVSVRVAYTQNTFRIAGLIKRRNDRFGDFTMGHVLGRSRIGEVRLVTCRSNKLAAKLLPKDCIDQQTVDRLAHEFEALNNLIHRHIVRIREVVIDQSYLGIVMDCAHYGDMFAYLCTHGRIDEPQAKRWLAQLVSAVDALHSQCLAHRDIKPENILVDANEDLILTDFEMCHSFKNHGFPMMSETCGSPTYCPPEAVTSPENLYDGCKADIWATGVTMYTCVAGYVPFDDIKFPSTTREGIKALYDHIVATELQFPTFMTSDLKHLLSRMLDKCYRTRASIVDVKAHPWLASHTTIWTNAESFEQGRQLTLAASSKLKKFADLWLESSKCIHRAPIIWDPSVGV